MAVNWDTQTADKCKVISFCLIGARIAEIKPIAVNTIQGGSKWKILIM